MCSLVRWWESLARADVEVEGGGADPDGFLSWTETTGEPEPEPKPEPGDAMRCGAMQLRAQCNDMHAVAYRCGKLQVEVRQPRSRRVKSTPQLAYGIYLLPSYGVDVSVLNWHHRLAT